MRRKLGLKGLWPRQSHDDPAPPSPGSATESAELLRSAAPGMALSILPPKGRLGGRLQSASGMASPIPQQTSPPPAPPPALPPAELPAAGPAEPPLAAPAVPADAGPVVDPYGIHLPVSPGGRSAAPLDAPPWWPPDMTWVPPGTAIGRLSSDGAVTLARRQHALTARQMSLVERLRSAAQDPATVAQLGAIGGLSHRMQRTAQTQLVLTGGGPARQVRTDLPLSEVLARAVQQTEVEDRVQLITAADPMIVGHLSVPLGHLIAELVENALTYGDTSADVIVQSSMTDQGLQLRVIDSGIGMAPAELEGANALLATTQVPAGESLSTWGRQHLGLFTCAQLAAVLDSRVALIAASSGGTMAVIDCSSALVAEAVADGTGQVHQIDIRTPAESIDRDEPFPALPADLEWEDPGPERPVAAQEDPSGPAMGAPGGAEMTAEDEQLDAVAHDSDLADPLEPVENPQQEEWSGDLGLDAASTDGFLNMYQPEVIAVGAPPLPIREPRVTR